MFPSRLKINTSYSPPMAIRLGLKGLTSIDITGASKTLSSMQSKPFYSKF
tara:strand:- start:381 stop:530 length:150 start_codon:yes stop_codon:yes gene_type:complete